jgi:hypothetical protein
MRILNTCTVHISEDGSHENKDVVVTLADILLSGLYCSIRVRKSLASPLMLSGII